MLNGSSNIDPGLAFVVSMVETMSGEDHDGPQVMLAHDGVIITGKVISGQQWVNAREQSYREAWIALDGPPDADAGIWPDLFKGLMDKLIRQRDESKPISATGQVLPEWYDRALDNIDQVTYIHLADVRLVGSGTTPAPAIARCWRCRLADVSGWDLVTNEPPPFFAATWK